VIVATAAGKGYYEQRVCKSVLPRGNSSKIAQDISMSEQTVAADPAVRRKAMLRALGLPLVMLAMIWGMFLLNALFAIDVTSYFSYRSDSEPMSVLTALYLALGFSPLLLGYAWFLARKALGLVDHGVEVTGKVTSIGKLGRHGMVPLRYSYVYRSTAYSGAVDILKDDAKKRRDEGKIRLLVNSRKPSQSDLYENIFKQ
jgi:hypothetical protein